MNCGAPPPTRRSASPSAPRGTTADADALVERHLDWSDRQRRILTADGRAEALFHPDRGVPFEAEELPHHLLLACPAVDRWRVLEDWRAQDRGTASPIAGAWRRVLFHGGWDRSTDADEATFNLQTRTLFVDLRVPVTRAAVLVQGSAAARSVRDLGPEELRRYARQHVFAGYARLQRPGGAAPFPWSCTRHHLLDWNFAGVPRARPNKWWIQLEPPGADGRRHGRADRWKEWAFARDEAGQFYYCEQWERIRGATSDVVGAIPEEMVLAIRRRPNGEGSEGILVVIGNEFAYCLSQCRWPIPAANGSPMASLVAVVDDAVARGDLATARHWLGSMQGGHGRVHTAQDNPTHNAWRIDTAIEFWREGESLLQPGDVTVRGSSMDDCTITWSGEEWDVFDSSFDDVETLVQLFNCLHLRRRNRPCDP